ncbi:hypothetical protein [Streptantibioticus ferralitis]|uniref:Peptidoglycan binding domain-containing protein n=1 Tax=Streptantibioticus ferralitis TaxID=236510 RepID=A0ABT5YSW5_9ACTN|nr:hypothetical protein [Streptantibioticus ferralitis]MDF2254697.1 hypothetical protein [Streptantibioticus ferralitis]
MSRETDSSSSGPQGRGGAAYPSGTPPYGTRQYPSLHPQEEPRVGGPAGIPGAPGSTGGQEASEPTPEEPKTETTLTTRIRINIPGSRPIPPVVMRTPVGEGADSEGAEDGSASVSERAGALRAKPSATPPGASGTAPGADDAGTGRGAESATASASGTDKGGPGTSDWFAPRKPPASSGQSAARPQPPTPTGASTSAAGGAGTGAPGAGQPNIPYLNGSPAGPRPPASGEPAFPGAGSQSEPFGGRLSGPPPGSPGSAAGESGPPPGSVPFPGFPSAQSGVGATPDIPEVPSGPTTGPMTGGMYMPQSGSAEAPGGFGRTGGGTGAAGPSDDLADHVSGDTLVSGIPAVTAAGPPSVPKEPAGRSSDDGAGPGAKSKARPARKGRSKRVLAGVGVLAVVGVAYAAGLLMDHADVPNGTTVLGVDIGGKTKDEAVKALDAAVGDRGTAPIKVHIGNQDKELKPQLAGLSIDTQASVRDVAHRDYNPISVIGSLFGGKHQVAPAVTVDQEKLRSQLQTLSSGSGNGTGGSDGMVKFVDGKPVGVPGTPYQAVDPDASVQKITAAYTQRAETGKDDPVGLAVTTHQPRVTQDAINEAIKAIGDPAMSGKITVTAGTKSVLFSPQKSLSKILTIIPAPGNGKLTLHIDLAVLKELYGNAFDGVLLERGIGTKTPVTPQDVASAMLPALGKTAPDKTAVIQNVAN